MNRFSPVLLAVSVATGCVSEAPRSPQATVVDSAGVRIVSHGSTGAGARAVAGQPDLAIGRGPDAAIDLYRVRGGVLLPDGGVAIANGGSQEVLYFTPTGEPLRRVGGEGQGPGEFSNIFWLQAGFDGAVFVSDPGNQKIVHLDPYGSVIESHPIRFEPEVEASERAMVGRGFAVAMAGPSRVVAVPWAVAELDGVDGPLPLRGELRSYSGDLSEFVAIDSVLLRTWYEAEQEEGPPIGQVYEAPVFVFSANGAWTAYSDATTHRVTVLEEGRPSYVIREARSRTPFTPDSVPEFYPAVADSTPSYRAVAVDADGRVWVRSGASVSDGVVEWRVFSRRGLDVDEIELPQSSDVLDARGDRVLLLERDELDVESVVIRRLVLDR